MTIRSNGLILLALAAILTPRVHGYRRIHEKNLRLQKPVWGTIAGLGFYSPTDQGVDGGAQLTTGLRYIRPDRDDDTWHSIAYEVTANSFSNSIAEVTTLDGGVFYYYPRSEAFSFDYHWFAGAGVGVSQVSRAATEREDIGIGFASAGLQGRIRDFFLEAKFKVIGSAPGATFPLDGSVLLLTGTYYFLP